MKNQFLGLVSLLVTVVASSAFAGGPSLPITRSLVYQVCVPKGPAGSLRKIQVTTNPSMVGFSLEVFLRDGTSEMAWGAQDTVEIAGQNPGYVIVPMKGFNANGPVHDYELARAAGPGQIHLTAEGREQLINVVCGPARN